MTAEPHEHWTLRVAQRIGPDVDAAWLWREVVASIAADDGWCRRKGRQKYDSRSVYSFVLDGTRYFCVFCDLNLVPVTILPPAAYLSRKGSKKRKQLARSGIQLDPLGRKQRARKGERKAEAPPEISDWG